MMNSLNEIVSSFNLLQDWNDRYAYIIDMSTTLPSMPDSLKIDDNKVHGCMSQVWVSAYHSYIYPEKIYFHGDCDTAVIKGVLAILIQLCNGKTAAQIQQLDVDEFFERLHLYDHLSPTRHVGVYAIVELMKKKAQALLDEEKRFESNNSILKGEHWSKTRRII